MFKQPFFLCVAIAGFFLHILPAHFARPNLPYHMGCGGGRIRIGESWVDVSRWELAQIVVELTPEEDAEIQTALHHGEVAVAQDLLAAAALRFFHKRGRTL
jgi:hypothetical protein